MREQEPSRTAFAAAEHRAAHQLLEQGRIFADPLALAVLGQDAETVARRATAEPARRGMRFFIAARARVAEAALHAGVETRGVQQLVVLGAGLDTFAYRNPFEGRLRVFEVDHPATQAWKRARLREAEIPVPNSLVFAPVDFEAGSLADGLKKADFDASQRSFFMWLGVVPYLTEASVHATLAFIGGLAGGAEVVFDYGEPREGLSAAMRAAHDERASRVAAAGEPFLSYFDPSALRSSLIFLGFNDIEDLGPRALAARYLGENAWVAPERGGHVIFAAKKGLLF